ncbi:uncharacterized protein LOC135707234, partial [Ochlerotatus camptorhynchus]|uniref:uncharacterized protein LOC135707234 n=1 Tax=Ochlerotatus camptorhynchus TaxID=644619 RepID=UPI0031D67920
IIACVLFLIQRKYPDTERPASRKHKLTFKGSVYEKRFKNLKNQDRCGSLAVGGDSADDVVRQIWIYCSKFVYRAAVFQDTIHESMDAETSVSFAKVSWDEEAPSYENCDNFLIFQDKTSKRSFGPAKVDKAMLQSWMSKEITVVVYRYSDSVTSLHRWNLLEQSLKRPLEKDRAGAESLVSVNKIKAELKVNHGRHLSGDDVNWGCWASWIATKPVGVRDKLMHETPPEHLISLFSSVPVHSDTLLEKARLDLQIVNNINKAYSRILRDLNNDHAVMGKRIGLMEDKQREYAEMLQAMNNSVAAKENRFSMELAKTLSDCIDVDHA